ncbi:DUF4242 domain-containing protein [Mariniphaga sediminis]|uniref:DUF4242 domain-containing protein n=1 Tax=Mariniphaga sediminis TaxID=1628158 RepID=A0A399D513_9BACT|nr:nickel-binding protein [Mariniphaga sediminis]RIH66749.1 DUF4242 domain-containing protein [Mariniphaga sediminis]
MPIFMDRHDVSESVTAEIVAQLHQQDLKIQHKFGCRGLTYWFDESRKMAFCLIEAPSENSIKEMHKNAHGEVPHQVIEVDAGIVESFLGRIQDPEKAKNTDLNIINDPAFRTIMVIEFVRHSVKGNGAQVLNIADLMNEIKSGFEGSVVKQYRNQLLVSFKSVSKAVTCALEISAGTLGSGMDKNYGFDRLKIGITSGVPVTGKDSIFEDAIKLAERMLFATEADISISTEVKELYRSENFNQFVETDQVLVLTPDDELFLTRLVDFIEEKWQNADLRVEDFQQYLGVSKSQLYRKTIHLTGKSPSAFLMSYRLNMALKMLEEQKGNISEIAFGAGFNSPSYFSKCFRRKYGIMPSGYLGAYAE